MNINKHIHALIAATLVIASCAIAQEPFVLAKDGLPQAVIVVDKNTTSINRDAAFELAKYLGAISKTDFMVTDKPVPGFKTIKVATPYKAQKPDEISIRVADKNTLEITGDAPFGPTFAVYDLIESFGVVFCSPEYEYIPSTNCLSIAGDYKKVDAPVFKWRCAWGDLWKNWQFSLKHRIQPGRGNARWNEIGQLPYNIDQTLPGKYLQARKYFKDHPEWYAWDHTTLKRRSNWVCASSEGMYEQLFKEIEEELKLRPTRHISVGLSDGCRMCECDPCKAIAAKYPLKSGYEQSYIQMLVIANRVAKRFPHIQVNFLNYGDLMPDHPDFKVEPNVGAGVAELWRNHCLSADNNERSEAALARLHNLIPEKTGIFIWDYLANFANYMLPFPNHTILPQTLRYYHKSGVQGIDSQTSFGIISDMNTLNFYLFGKLHWNPYQDVQKLTEKYVKATYGAAAPHILNYLDILEHARLRQRYTWYGCYVTTANHYLTGEDSVRILREFEKADAIKGLPRVQRVLVRRAKIAALINTIFEYNNMIEPAKKLNFKLRPLADYVQEWKNICSDSSNNYSANAYAERPWIYSKWCDMVDGVLNSGPTAPTKFSDKYSCIVIPAAKMTGGIHMKKEKAKEGFEYARISVSLTEDVNHLWMEPKYGEVGFTATEEEAGDWYVFATVRVSTTVPHDQAAFYFGIYTPLVSNGYKLKNLAEIADMPVNAWGGETQWRTICLGKRRFIPGTRVWLMNGILNKVNYFDIKEFKFVSPKLIEGSVLK